MWGIILSFLVKLFTGWVGEKERTHESEKAGAEAQAISTERQAQEKTNEAVAAVGRVRDLDDRSLRDIPPGDPDFRD